MRRPRPFVAAVCAAVLVLFASSRPGPAAAASLAGTWGSGSADIQVFNLDVLKAAGGDVDFYRHITSKFTDRQPIGHGWSAPPGDSTYMKLPVNGEIPHALYGARLEARQPIGALVRTDWGASLATMLYSAIRPATEVVVPLYVKRAQGQDGAIAVMVESDEAADVELTLWSADGALALHETYAFGAHEPRILPLHALPPPGTPFPGIGFIGWASLRSTVPLAAVGLVDGSWTRSAYAYEGVPLERTGKTLHAPFVRRSPPRGGGDTVTTLWLANPNDRVTNVSVRYVGNTGPCAGQSFVDGPHAVAPHAMARFDPRAAGALPVNCVAAATVVADANVAAVVVDTIEGGGKLAAYTVAATADAATRIALPTVRREYTTMKLTSAIAVQNTSATAANVEIAFRDADDNVLTTCGAPCRAVVAPGAGHLFYPSRTLNSMPVGTSGSATVTSDQPIVAVVEESSETGASDALIYTGVPWPATAPAVPLLAPFVLNHAIIDFAPTVTRRFFPWGATGR